MQPGLKEQIEQAAAVLRRYGATEVFLFGSATSEQNDNPRDVDMAVEGLPPEVFFRAYSAAAQCLDREMDLIRLEEDNPFTRFLRRKGKLKRVG